MPGPKMPKSPSELFGTDRRSPNHSAQAVHPDSLRALGAHTGRSRHIGFWRGHRPPRWRSAIAHAERRPSTWVGALGMGAASDAHGPAGKAGPAFQSAES
jgi:hypothetical protein